MSGQMIVVKHACRPPLAGVTHRSVWQCECGRRYRFIHPGNPQYAHWRPTIRTFFGLHRRFR